MADRKYNTEDINNLIEEFSSGVGNDVDQIIRDIRRELQDDLPEYPETNSDSPVPSEPEEFRDQEYLETFGDQPLSLYESTPEPKTERPNAERPKPEASRNPTAGKKKKTKQSAPEPAKSGKKLSKKSKKRRKNEIDPKNGKKKRTKKPSRRGSAVFGIFGTLIYVVMVAAIALLLAKFIWLCADDVLALTKEDQLVSVTIQKGATLDDIAEQLHDKGLIHYPWLFKIYGHYAHVEDKVDSGVYELNTLFDYHALVNAMSGYSAREITTVTVIEGYSYNQIFQQLEDAQVCSVEDLEKVAAEHEFDYAFLQDVPYGEPNRLEGYLYPDTYDFYLSDDPVNVIEKFLDNFEYRFDEELMEQVEQSGYTLRQILTVASIIEEEAASEEERPDIASVIYNRLASDSLQYLQMDSTVFYAAMLLGTEFNTELDSPYNTYLYAGLPVGPIDSPGMNSIQAALEPNETNYYYFAYGTDGVSHFFSDFDSFSVFLSSDEYAG